MTSKKGIVGITVGAFDLCHCGHIRMFKEAKEVCDWLIVGVQADPSVTPASYRGKKKNRPIMSVEERMEILEANKYIDELFVYQTEADLLKHLKKISWDVRIIGEDWRGKHFTGWDIGEGKIYYNSRKHNFSTSELRRRVWKSEEQERLKRENET